MEDFNKDYKDCEELQSFLDKVFFDVEKKEFTFGEKKGFYQDIYCITNGMASLVNKDYFNTKLGYIGKGNALISYLAKEQYARSSHIFYNLLSIGKMLENTDLSEGYIYLEVDEENNNYLFVRSNISTLSKHYRQDEYWDENMVFSNSVQKLVRDMFKMSIEDWNNRNFELDRVRFLIHLPLHSNYSIEDVKCYEGIGRCLDYNPYPLINDEWCMTDGTYEVVYLIGADMKK